MTHLPTLREFLHEYLHHYVAAESKLYVTVKLLLLRPGQLTLEYLAGRRQRYVKPLALYVTFSFLFFLLLSWSSGGSHPHVVVFSQDTNPPSAQTALADADAHAAPDEKRVLDFVARLATELSQPSKLAEFQQLLLHRIPYAVFVLMPLFAAMCALVYRRRHQTYGLHLLFTIHLHAFLFTVLLACLLPWVGHHAGWALLLLLLYLVAALKRVHGGRWWPQLCRGLLLALSYAIVSSLAVAVVALISTGIPLNEY